MDKLNEFPDILTISELLDFLRISRNTLMKEIKEGRIKCIKVGRQYRFTKIDVIEYINKTTNNEINNHRREDI